MWRLKETLSCFESFVNPEFSRPAFLANSLFEFSQTSKFFQILIFLPQGAGS